MGGFSTGIWQPIIFSGCGVDVATDGGESATVSSNNNINSLQVSHCPHWTTCSPVVDIIFKLQCFKALVCEASQESRSEATAEPDNFSSVYKKLKRRDILPLSYHDLHHCTF